MAKAFELYHFGDREHKVRPWKLFLPKRDIQTRFLRIEFSKLCSVLNLKDSSRPLEPETLGARPFFTDPNPDPNSNPTLHMSTEARELFYTEYSYLSRILYGGEGTIRSTGANLGTIYNRLASKHMLAARGSGPGKRAGERLTGGEPPRKKARLNQSSS